MEYTTYTTKTGDRWDLVAYQAYGDHTAMQGIMEANPTVPIPPPLDAGIQLRIPIIETQTTEVKTQLLPPWKR